MSKKLVDDQDRLDGILSLAFETYYLRVFSALCRESWERRNKDKTIRRTYNTQAYESAFFVHLRVVLYFFYVGPDKEDDLAICHYREMTRFKLPPDKDMKEVFKVKANLDKRVAHLTKGRRVRPPGTDLYFNCADKLLAVMDKFVKKLPDELQTAFRDRTNAFVNANTKTVKPIL